MHPSSRPSAREGSEPWVERRTLKKRAETADMRSMDVLGASMLAARIRAGVRIGQMIELLGDSSTSADLKRGDIGLVAGFSANGNILVRWSGGGAFVAGAEASCRRHPLRVSPAWGCGRPNPRSAEVMLSLEGVPPVC